MQAQTDIELEKLRVEAKEKKRAVEIWMAQIGEPRSMPTYLANIQADKELALKELEGQDQAQSQATTSATVDPPHLNKDAKSPKLSAFILKRMN